jgi:hypothetical protein
VRRTRAASFKSLYRKRANTPCSCLRFARSRFRYNARTYQALAAGFRMRDALFAIRSIYLRCEQFC